MLFQSIEDKAKPLIITGTGRAFCTGGDLNTSVGLMTGITKYLFDDRE